MGFLASFFAWRRIENGDKCGNCVHTKVGVIVMSKASVYFTLGNINTKHDRKEIKRELDTLPGVLSVSISDGTDRVAVDFDTTGVQRNRIEMQLEKMGYQILDSQTDGHIK